MTAVRRGLWVAALLAAAAAVALLVWPMNANGVHGNALRPRYTDFGVESYTPLPQHPTRADFARAGITLPQDRVHDRRVEAAAAAAGAALLLVLALALELARRRPSQSPDTGHG